MLLWFGPFIFLLIGIFVLIYYLKQRKKLIKESPLSDEQLKTAEKLLKSNSNGDNV